MEWTLDPVGGAWFAGMVAVGLLALPWLLPPRGAGLTPRRRRVIQWVRTLATLVLLFAWLRPTVVRVRTEVLRPALAVLLDASRSMSVEDAAGGVSRWRAVRRMMDASRAALAELTDSQDVRLYAFDRNLRPITLADSGEAELSAEPVGEQTALGAAIVEALDAARGSGDGLVGGVVVVTDGAQRATPPRDLSPIAAASRVAAEGAPLHTLVVGDRAAAGRADLAIDDLVAPDAAFAGAPLTVSATLRAEGFANRPVRVRLLWEEQGGGMAPVDAAEATLAPGESRRPIRLRHTPAEPGEWKLSVVADAAPGETLTDNNTASTFLTVRAGGVRVIYLAGSTRAGGAAAPLEGRFLRRSLAASPDVAVELLPIDNRPNRRDLASRVGRDKADVLLLDNVDADALDRATWRAIVGAVDAGGGLAMIGGKQAFGPGGHRATLGDVLPVTPGRAERQAIGAAWRPDVHLPGPLRLLPADGRAGAHPIVQITADPEPSPAARRAAWEALPPLLGANRLGDRLKPGAVAIATTDDARRAPLLVVGAAGLGRTLAFAGDSTWRWVLGGHREAHQRFWRQAVLWLAKKDDDPDARVAVELSTRRAPAGAPVDVRATVRGAVGDDASDVTLDARIERPDGTVSDAPLAGSAEFANGVVTDTAAAGDYRVTVTARRGDETIGTASARFTVPRRDLELERPAADPDALARLSRATAADGGRALAVEELPTLLAEIAAEPPRERREVISRKTLWDTWPVLLVFAGAMTAEWLLRRRWGLP
ncbi:MAG: hypothetical protein AAF805_05210 [Planctomycetota bacterium]